MFTVNEYKNKYTGYEIRDHEYGSYIRVVPEIGGIVTDFNMDGEGNELYIYQEYINNSEDEMPFYAGFHPYFTVGGKKALKFNIDAGVYQDYDNECIKTYKGEIDFDYPVDFVFTLNNPGENGYVMVDPGKGRKITIETDEYFKYMVMWTMEGKDFVCLEPWMAPPDAMNTGTDLCKLAPGKALKTRVKIRVDKI